MKKKIFLNEFEKISETNDKKKLEKLLNSRDPYFRLAVASNIRADVRKLLRDEDSCVREMAAKTASAQEQIIFINNVKRKIRKISKEIKNEFGVEK